MEITFGTGVGRDDEQDLAYLQTLELHSGFQQRYRASQARGIQLYICLIVLGIHNGNLSTIVVASLTGGTRAVGSGTAKRVRRCLPHFDRVKDLTMNDRGVQDLQGEPASSIDGSAAALAERHAVMRETLLRSAYTDEYSREERDEMRNLLLRLSKQYTAMTGRQLN
ncbi:hypothetical protein [Stutzerimonas nitrititolerans]|uniref:hypothetical protein n=1 Tax=Stutzerimonas nitrititolerans TaxID=2482751 RepID=UPI0035E461F9